VTTGRDVTRINSGRDGSNLAIGCDADGNIYYAWENELTRLPSIGLPSGAQSPSPVSSLDLASRISPFAFAVAADGTGFIADTERNIIKEIRPGADRPTIYVGSGNPGYLDGKGIFSSFLRPNRLGVTKRKELFVAEPGTDRLRFVGADRTVVTLTNTAEFARSDVLAADDLGNLYAQWGNAIVKRYADGRKTLVAGSVGESGYVNGPGPAARFNGISGLAVVSPTVLLVADSANYRVRRVFLQADTGESPILTGSLHFGVTVKGLPGREYRLESTDAVGAPWKTLTNFVMSAPSSLWLSPSLEGQGIFRSVLVR